MEFTHLHVHTEYSLLDGSAKTGELVARAKELGMDSLAITDHGVMYGVIDFYRACKKEGIRPVIGCEVYVAPGSRFDKEAKATEDRYYHLVLLAENNTGYQNLIKIVSKGFTEGYYYKPRVDYEVLEQYHEGIIALSACLAGEVAVNIRRGMYEEAKKTALRLEGVFGKGNFFLELQDHGIPEQKSVNQAIMRLNMELGIPLVATNDTHYIYENDAEAHDILLCLQTQKKVTDTDRMRYDGGQYYVKSAEQMAALFPYAPEAIKNTHDIAMRCNVEIEFGHYKLPKFEVPDNEDAWEYLKRLSYEGLRKRYPDTYKEHEERMQYELDVIHNMGFVDYFLIVMDFIRYAKNNDIPVGPGRGSGAASIVAYALGITDIDTIKYQLVFERFLNPERLTMPDFDVDFCYERRPEVIDYVVKKYGKEQVVQIVTFGTLAARGVIRDVGRVLDFPYAQTDMIAKMIPTELGITIDKAIEANSELRNLYNTDEQIKYLIDMSRRLEGLPRHTSMHAAGVIISNAPADEYVPLSRGSDGTIVTQYTMTTLEELGLLKMDFLGLRTLTVIKNAVKQINRHTQLDIEKLNYDDAKVYEMIGTGKTEGVFQLESAGMKNFMKELKPGSLEDVIAGISLYRPGPMDFIPKYISGKNNPGQIVYDCPQLEEILKPTYGCIVYQEQVMQIVRSLAGYSFGRSDLVRRAMSKKKADVMARERQNFVYGNQEEGVKGCIANGISEETANKIFDEMTDFAKYAFNKAHAACYAYVAYQTAYLKHYYPKEFMAALMTSVLDNTGKVAGYVYNCRQLGIAIYPPDINEGEGDFSVCGEGIRYGMNAIKGLGREIINSIIAERTLNGRFKDLPDFMERMYDKGVNRKSIEGFIKSGALDSLPGNRRQKMLIYAKLADDIAKDRKNSMSGQLTLFDFADDTVKSDFAIKLPEVPEYEKEEMLAFEKEVMGIYVSGHPLDDYMELMSKNITADSTAFQVDEENTEARVEDGSMQVIGGIVTAKSVKTTKNNTMMAFITLEDVTGSVEVILFSREYEKFKYLIDTDAKIFVRGKVNAEEEKAAKLICQNVVPFDKIPSTLWIQFESKMDFAEKEQTLYSILGEHSGNNEVIIYCKNEKVRKSLKNQYDIDINDEIMTKLSEKFSLNNLKIVSKTIEKL